MRKVIQLTQSNRKSPSRRSEILSKISDVVGCDAIPDESRSKYRDQASCQIFPKAKFSKIHLGRISGLLGVANMGRNIHSFKGMQIETEA